MKKTGVLSTAGTESELSSFICSEGLTVFSVWLIVGCVTVGNRTRVCHTKGMCLIHSLWLGKMKKSLKQKCAF